MTNTQIALLILQAASGLLLISATVGLATTFAISVLVGHALNLSFWQVAATGFVASATLTAVHWVGNQFKD